jgi:hypothetical protein
MMGRGRTANLLVVCLTPVTAVDVHGYAEVVTDLLQEFDQFRVQQNFVTPLALAVEFAKLEILRELLADVILLVVSLYHNCYFPFHFY